MTANPTALSFYGIAHENVKGTYTAPTDYLPLTKFDPVDKTVWLKDDGMRGSMAKEYNLIAGPVYSEISCSGPVFPDTIGYPLVSLLGDITVTGASAPFTHTAALKNSGDGQPISDSLTDFNSVDTRGYSGTQWYGMDFKWDGEKLLDWTGTAKGFQSASQSKPAASFTGITALPGWLCLFTINSIASTTLVSGDISIKRAGGPINTADGTQSPYQMFAGDVTVTGKLVVVADTNLQLTNYLAATKMPLDFNWTQGAGAALVQLKLHMSNCNLNDVKTQRGKEFTEYEIDFSALPNSADAGAGGGLSHVKATLQNAKASGTFA